jgi:hypothetical protein
MHPTSLVTRRIPIALILAASVAACRGDAGGARGRTASGATAAGATAAGTSATASAARDCGTPLIEGSGVGQLRIGASVDSVGARCIVLRDTTVTDNEGMPQRALDVAAWGDTVRVEIADGRVWRVTIDRPGLRTADSLGVGTPLSRLLTLDGAHGLIGEGRLFVAAPSHCGVSFELNRAPGEVPRDGWTAEHLRALPPSTAVVRVLVFGCHDAAP